MNWQTFDESQNQLLSEERYEEAEEQLVAAYEEAKKTADRESLAQLTKRLGHFYSYPMTEDLDRAALFFREAERYDTTPQRRLDTAIFTFDCRNDPAATLQLATELVSASVLEEDPAVYFHALCLKGECLWSLGRLEDIRSVLDELLQIATQCTRGVVLGDAFSLLRKLIHAKKCLPQCIALLDIFLAAPLSQQSRNTALELRDRSLVG